LHADRLLRQIVEAIWISGRLFCLKRASIGGFYIFDKYILMDNIFVFYIILSI